MPIPASKKSDHEDVAWALSTAEAQWGRGELEEALKWLRRAAESASEAEDDVRALELAKAAADVSAEIETRRVSPQAATPKPAPSTPVGAPAPAQSAPKPSAATLPSAASKTPLAPKVAPRPSPSEAPHKLTATPKAPQAAAAAAVKQPGTKRGRKSMPPAEERTDVGAKVADDTAPQKTRDSARRLEGDHGKEVPTARPASAPSAAEVDAWPTEAMSGAELPGDLTSFDRERTRIGAPAYQPPPPEHTAVGDVNELRRAMDAAPNAAADGAGIDRVVEAASGLRVSQAVRVVVWSDGAGVHVAPAGTTVTAITVEALLVAVDPSADLSAWLSKK